MTTNAAETEMNTQEYFNKLTPAQAERIAMLMEECGEVVQICGKILRHGLESFHPEDSFQTSNRALLSEEIGDLHSVTEALIKAGDMIRPTKLQIESIWKRKLRYTHHQ